MEWAIRPPAMPSAGSPARRMNESDFGIRFFLPRSEPHSIAKKVSLGILMHDAWRTQKSLLQGWERLRVREG
jgi:hypothetical protein